MKYCKRCIQPNTRPGIVFSEDQVCGACLYWDKRQGTDWKSREEELQSIAERSKHTTKIRETSFDCIIGVSGGKDSHYQAWYAREKLGLKCLLVNCAPDDITPEGAANLEDLVQQGYDLISIRPNPNIMREATKISFFKYGNPVKPSEYPLFAVTYHMALAMNIPLVIQGENPSGLLGLSFAEPDGNALNIFQHNTMGGGDASEWLYDGITMKDLFFFQAPNAKKLQQNLTAIWLEYYDKNWSWWNNTKVAVAKGLRGKVNRSCEEIGKLNKYAALDSIFQPVNQMMKYLKFGFGSTTDECCSAIREGWMTRDEAIKYAELYDGKCSEEFIEQACKYMRISKTSFYENLRRWTNIELFTGTGKPRFKVGTDYEN